jgi:hypothetical protein
MRHGEEAAGEGTARSDIHPPATSNATAGHQQCRHRRLELKVAAPRVPDLEREGGPAAGPCASDLEREGEGKAAG